MQRDARPSRPLSRRDLLKAAGLTATGGLLAACAANNQAARPEGAASSSAPAAGSAPAAAKPAGPNRPLVIAPSGNELPAWSPYSDAATAYNSIWAHVFQQLVEYDWERKQLYGILAESWAVAPDGATWTFKLRQGVRFHDGAPFTARDVVYSVNRARNDADSKVGQLLELRDVQAADDYTVVFTPDKPDAVFPVSLRSVFMTSHLAPERYGADHDQRQVGTGAFKFVEWVRGSHYLVERNESYWGTMPQLGQVMWKPFPDVASRVAALEAGQVDIGEALPTQEAQRLERSPNLRVERMDNVVTYFLGISPAIKPFDDPRVRQAILLSIDVDSVIKNVLDGAAKRLTGPVPDALPGHDPAWRPPGYDPDRARALLAQAGYPDGISIDLHTTSGRYVKDVEINQAFAGQMAKAGIRATVRPQEFAAYFADIRAGKLGLYYWVRPDGPDPSYLGPTYYKSGSKRINGYSNPQVDALWDESQAEFDPAKRDVLLRRLLTMINDDAVSVFLWTQQDLYGVNRRLQWRARPDSRLHVHRAVWES